MIKGGTHITAIGSDTKEKNDSELTIADFTGIATQDIKIAEAVM